MTEMMQAVSVQGKDRLALAEVARPSPGPGEVLVRVFASGLNRADLLQRKGLYPPPKGASEVMGLECAGEIIAMGESVRHWEIGDRVCALLAGGGYAEYAAVDAGSLLPIPADMSFAQAACLPEAMMTVWANVYDRCALLKGESFLVHGGTSGIGVMALQMARIHGAARIFATAGTDEKCEVIVSLGGEKATAINYRRDDFEAVISAAGGVDVILDMVGADYVQRNMTVAKISGRIVNIAYMNGPNVNLNLLPLMLKRLILTGTTLRARTASEKSGIRERMQQTFWSAVETGDIKPVLDTVFPASEAEAAQALMTRGGHIGKIVLVW